MRRRDPHALDAARPWACRCSSTRYDAFAADAQWGRWLDKGTGAEPDSLMRGPRGHEIADAVKPAAADIVITKSKPSGVLRHAAGLGCSPTSAVDTVVVTGMVTPAACAPR